MELTNEFRVNVPVDDAWAVLTDIERIAPAMPGAQLQEVEGDEYRGIVKVKVGPITAQYKGTARFQEQDKEAHRVVLRAEGRDTRGQGNASATVTATLVPDGEGTKVTVVTDLTITGKVAQFGRGVLADVSTKLLGQFVDNLERDVLSGGASPNGNASVASGASGASAASAASGASTASTAGAAAPAAAPATAYPAPDPAAPAASAAAAPEARAAATTTATATDTSAARRIDHPEPEPVDLFQAAGQPVAKRVVPLVGGLLAVFIVWRFLARRRR
ncbi:MAG TPA: SRPBCC family protein [Acidimicrobiales bacterium]|nr:SRPBCC family protein [Acidimicrobiales bacterium]